MAKKKTKPEEVNKEEFINKDEEGLVSEVIKLKRELYDLKYELEIKDREIDELKKANRVLSRKLQDNP